MSTTMASSPTTRDISDNVLITLSVKYPPEDFAYPERRIRLDRSNKSVKIGRTSKRMDHLTAALNNCWFDSPVMSRNHAEIFVDWFYHKVYIKDTGSLHGTYHNQDRVVQGSPHALVPGDTIRFGIDIQRSTDLYPPCTVEVAIEFWPNNPSGTINEPGPPTVFQVPDESDSDRDSSSDEEDDDVRTSLEILRRTGIRRAPRVAGGSSEDLIDLTQDSNCQITNNPQVLTTPNRVQITIDAEPLTSSATNNTFIDLTEEIPQERFPSIESDAPHEDDELENLTDGELSNLSILAYENTGSESPDSMFGERDTSVDYPEEQISQASRGPSHEIGVSEAEDAICLSEFASGSSDDEDEDDDEGETDEDNASELDSNLSSLSEVMSADDVVDDYNVLWPGDEVVNEVDHPAPVPGMIDQPVLPQMSSFAELPPNALRPIPPPYNSQFQFMGRDDVCRLPSILNPPATQSYPSPDTASQYPRPHPWQRPLPAVIAPNSAAEELGHKTGKLEFFTARELNKEAIARQHQNGPLPPIAQISPPLPPSPVAVKAVAIDGHPQQTIVTQATNEPKTVVRQATNGSVWSASGERFLNSPPQEFPVSNERDGSPEFDMTSAYQFQQSKLAADSRGSNDSVANALHIGGYEEDPADEPEQVLTPKSLKRKAEDISALSPEEEKEDVHRAATLSEPEEAMITAGEAPHEAVTEPATNCAAPELLPGATPGFALPPPSTDKTEDTHAPKRIRRVAEAVGYVALGGAAAGVAFLTTLIATAPSFS